MYSMCKLYHSLCVISAMHMRLYHAKLTKLTSYTTSSQAIRMCTVRPFDLRCQGGGKTYLNAITTALTTLYLHSNKPNAATFVH